MAGNVRQLRLSGSGGQGLILLGIILAEAAVLDGMNVVQSQSYGPEARGGASRAEVIISDRPIYFPKVVNPGLLLAMTQEAVNKYTGDLPPAGILVVDGTFVKSTPPEFNNVYRLPITTTATEKLGKALFANIVALGAVASVTGVLSRDAVVRSLLGRVPAGTEDINMKAFELGEKLLAK